MNPRKHNIFLIFILVLFVTTTAICQTNSVILSIDTVSVNKTSIISETDIVEQLVKSTKDLKKIEEENNTERAIIEIDSLIPPYIEFIEQRQILQQNFVKANPNRQKIDNLINKWLGYKDFLNGWKAIVNNETTKKVIILDQISSSELIWELTYNKAVEKELPELILNRIKSVWESYKETNSTTKSKKNNYLNLENKITDQIIITDAVIDELVILKNSDVYSLFYLRHAPFWKESTQADMDNTIEKVGVESISKNINDSKNYIQSQGNAAYLFFLTLVFLTVVILLIKKRFIKYPLADSDQYLRKVKEVIVDNTFWVLLFMTLVLIRLFFPNTPKLFYDVLVLLMIFSAFLLVRPYIHKKFRSAIYFILLIMILDFAKTYIWLSSFQYRLYLLIETCLLLAVLIYFTYNYRKARTSDLNKLSVIIDRFIPIAYFLVAITYLSNILGYTNLTDFILKFFIKGGDLSLIFYAILLLLNGIILGFTDYHYNNRLTTFDPENKKVVESKLKRLIRVIAILLWLFYLLNLIDIYATLSKIVSDIFSEPYIVGEVTFTLGTIFMFLAILAGSYLITRVISFLLDGNEIKLFSFKLTKGIPAAISMVIRYFILAFGAVLALSYVGIDLSEFNLLAGALGLGIGFGLQTIVSNFISGIILIFERPILPGDVVEVNNLIGTVNKIGVRASRINTYDGAEVVVPNNNLISEDLINWTLSNNIKRVEILIGTAYGTDPNEVLKILEQVTNENKEVLKNPPAKALFDTFGESSLNFRLLFWVYFQNGLQSKSDVSIAVYNRFEELGIKIPFPQQEVYLTQKKPKP